MIMFGLGFSSYDVALMLVCPIGAMLGSLAQAIVQTIDLKGPPTKESDMTLASPALQVVRGGWLALRFILGAILGLVIGLYFVGAIQENPATLAKITALSILAGYAAPKVWAAQERIVSAKISKIVHAEVADSEKPAKDDLRG
jgi:hypothetical protein